jgi:putative phosphoesterase
VFQVNGVSIGLCHGTGSYHDIIPRLKELFKNDGVKIIMYGHTHTPTMEEIEGILFFNPGDGKKTVGLMEIDEDGQYKARIFEL